MDIQKMMQQAKTMQDKMQSLQTQLADKEVEGTSGGGMVKVKMSCKGECKGIEIDPSMIKAEEKEILEDLLKAALNDAKGRADTKLAEETQKLMTEMGLPANMQMPF